MPALDTASLPPPAGPREEERRALYEILCPVEHLPEPAWTAEEDATALRMLVEMRGGEDFTGAAGRH